VNKTKSTNITFSKPGNATTKEVSVFWPNHFSNLQQVRK